MTIDTSKEPHEDPARLLSAGDPAVLMSLHEKDAVLGLRLGQPFRGYAGTRAASAGILPLKGVCA